MSSSSLHYVLDTIKTSKSAYYAVFYNTFCSLLLCNETQEDYTIYVSYLKCLYYISVQIRLRPKTLFYDKIINNN